MKDKFLGSICLLYSGIILYVTLTDTLKNFLAPQMQIYLKASILPFMIMGIFLLFHKSHHKFIASDLILILPLIMLLVSGDGKLTASFAANRMINVNKTSQVTTKSVIKEEKEREKETIQEKRQEEIEENQIDLRSLEDNQEESTKGEEEIYFDITDEVYNDLSNYLTYESKATKFAGKTIRIRGFAVKNPSFASDKYFAIGKYTISCCAADAGFVGFIAEYDKKKIKDDTWYEIEGVLTP